MGFFPQERVFEELDKGAPTAVAHHSPVDGGEEVPEEEGVVTAFIAAEEVDIDEGEVADKETEGTGGKDRARVESGDSGGLDNKPGEGEEPEDGIYKGREDRAADEELEVGEVAPADFTCQAEWVTHMDNPGLDIPFLPAGALAYPEREAGAGLLPGGSAEHAGSVTGSADADTEVAIFGDVIGIPAEEVVEDIDFKVV